MEDLLKKLRNSPPTLLVSQGLRNVYVQATFWLMIAVLVFIQDYVDSSINEKGYFVSESLLYKIFWLLFIPFSLGWFRLLDHLSSETHYLSWIKVTLFALIIGLAHLIVFSVLLNLLSTAIFLSGWSLGGLFNDVLTRRAYFVLAVYLTYGFVYPWLKLRESSQTQSDRRIKLKIGVKSYIIPMNEIRWITVENAVTRVKTSTRKHVFGGSLKEISDKLDPTNFKQIHRSTIVNINEVEQLTSRLNGDYDVTMKDGTQLRLSRNYVKSIKGQLL